MVERRGEYIRDDPREISFVDKENKIQISLKINHPEMDQLSDDAREQMELLSSGFATILLGNLKYQSDLAMVGMTLEESFSIVAEKLEEAATILESLGAMGFIRKQ